MVSAKYQPWHKRVLIPFWVVQLGFMLWLIISTSTTLQYSRTRLGGGYLLVLSFCCTCLLLDVVGIILFIAGKLQPLFYLLSQVIETTLWLVPFIIDVVILALDATHNRNSTVIVPLAITTAIFTIILLSFVATLIYAAIIYHSARRGRADRTCTSSPYQNASPAYDRDNAPSFTPRPAPAHVADTEIGRERADAAIFEIAGTSHSLPSHELENGNTPGSVIPNGRKV